MATPFEEAVQYQKAKREFLQNPEAAMAKQQSVRAPSTGDIVKQMAALFVGPVLGQRLAGGIGDSIFGKAGEGAAGGGGGLFSGLGNDFRNLGSSIKEDVGGLGDKISGLFSSGSSGGGYAPTPPPMYFGPSPSAGSSIGASGLGPITDPRDLGINPPLQADIGTTTGGIPGLQGFQNLSGLGQALSAAAILHGGYNMFNDFGGGDAKSGAMSGAEMAAGLYPILGPWSLAAIPIGAGLGAIKTGKTNESHIKRDDLRKFLFESGVSPEAGYLSTADGGKFDINDHAAGRGAYQIDQSNALAAEATGLLNPLGEISTDGDPLLAGQTTGFYTNAALQGATDRETMLKNVRYQYQAAGVSEKEARRAMQQLGDMGRITQSEMDAYLNGLNDVFGTKK